MSEKEQIDARALARFIGDGRCSVHCDESRQAGIEASGVQMARSSGGGRVDIPRYEDAMREFERSYLMDALRANGGRVAETAEQIGMSRATLYRRVTALGIEV